MRENGNSFYSVLAIILLVLCVPLVFFMSRSDHPIEHIISLITHFIVYSLFIFLIICLVFLLLWVIKLVFADFVEALNKEMHIDMVALMGEYRNLFQEEFPFLCKWISFLKKEKPDTTNNDNDNH